MSEQMRQCHWCGGDFTHEPFLGTVTEGVIKRHPRFCSGEHRAVWAMSGGDLSMGEKGPVTTSTDDGCGRATVDATPASPSAHGCDPLPSSSRLAGLLIRVEQLLVDARIRTSYERFERDAARFYRETGYMAPGKSLPLEMCPSDDAAREAKWLEWVAARKAEYIQTLSDVLDLLRSLEGQGPKAVTRGDRKW